MDLKSNSNFRVQVRFLSAVQKRSVRLGVRTLAFQAKNTGSIPVRSTNTRLMEMVDIIVLEAMAVRRGGSSPSSGTN